MCIVQGTLGELETKRMCDMASELAATAKQTPAQCPRANDRGNKDEVINRSSDGGGPERAGSKERGTLAAPRAQPRGAEKRKHPTLGEKAEILDLLSNKKMKQAFVAEKTGYALRTIQRVVADSKKIETRLKEQPSAAKQKSLRGARNQEVRGLIHFLVDTNHGTVVVHDCADGTKYWVGVLQYCNRSNIPLSEVVQNITHPSP